jgi:hypothetical protein
MMREVDLAEKTEVPVTAMNCTNIGLPLFGLGSETRYGLQIVFN